MCHLYVNDLKATKASPNRLIFEALLCSSPPRLTEILNILLSARIDVYLNKGRFFKQKLWSLFFAVPLNEPQMDAEEKEKEQSGGTKARMRQEKPAGAWHTYEKRSFKKKTIQSW